jgi:hypothetical protein
MQIYEGTDRHAEANRAYFASFLCKHSKYDVFKDKLAQIHIIALMTGAVSNSEISVCISTKLHGAICHKLVLWAINMSGMCAKRSTTQTFTDPAFIF